MSDNVALCKHRVDRSVGSISEIIVLLCKETKYFHNGYVNTKYFHDGYVSVCISTKTDI